MCDLKRLPRRGGRQSAVRVHVAITASEGFPHCIAHTTTPTQPCCRVQCGICHATQPEMNRAGAVEGSGHSSHAAPAIQVVSPLGGGGGGGAEKSDLGCDRVTRTSNECTTGGSRVEERRRRHQGSSTAHRLVVGEPAFAEVTPLPCLRLPELSHSCVPFQWSVSVAAMCPKVMRDTNPKL